MLRLLLGLLSLAAVVSAYSDESVIVLDIEYSAFVLDETQSIIYTKAFEAGLADALNISSDLVRVLSVDETRTLSTQVYFSVMDTKSSTTLVMNLFEQCVPEGLPPIGCPARLDFILSLRSAGLPAKGAVYSQEDKPSSLNVLAS